MRGKNKMINTEVTASCNSSEEFLRGFAPEKGDSKMINTEVSTSCNSSEEFNSDLFEIKGIV